MDNFRLDLKVEVIWSIEFLLIDLLKITKFRLESLKTKQSYCVNNSSKVIV